MAFGSTNTPGVSGAELRAVQQVANNASETANAAKNTANSAQTTATAAMEKANSAEQAATAAARSAASALESASEAGSAATAAAQNAASALQAANAAQTAAQQAQQAAENAQETANSVSQALSDLNSTINSVPSQAGTLYYTGSAQTPSWNGYDSEKMTINVTAKTNAGTYDATVTPKSGFKWPDGTATAKTITWKITPATVAIPTVSQNPTYTGSAVSPTWNGYDTNKMTLNSGGSSTNAGSVTAKFQTKANYQWPDGSTSEKSVTWSINKAAGSLTIDKSTMALNVSNLTGYITPTKAGDGALSAVSSNTAVATVAIENGKVKVTAKAKGSATITIRVAAGTNHNAPADKTCAVTVTMPAATLSDNDPATIQAAAKAGNASSLWSVGDKIGIALNGTVGALALNGTYYAFILGFNHNSAREGNNSIHFQFGKTAAGADIAFVDSNYNTTGSSAGFRMNTSNTNSGGWKSSYMRSTICPAFLAAMPTAWQNVIVECTKYSDNTGGGSDTASYVNSTSDKIWLLAEWEVFGARTGANSAEQNYQQQYDYYKNGNSKIKNKHNDTATACAWWLRSVSSGNTTSFRYVSTGGSGNNYYAYASHGFAPGFKVA